MTSERLLELRERGHELEDDGKCKHCGTQFAQDWRWVSPRSITLAPGA